jgi:hypothetical protein
MGDTNFHSSLHAGVPHARRERDWAMQALQIRQYAMSKI